MLALRMRVSMSAIGSVTLISTYQLDFVTPGRIPWLARSRKQIRHSANRRMKPRGRPHTEQRFRSRTLNRAGRIDRAILEVFAILVLS